MSRVVDENECDCSCHDGDGSTMHSFPCCTSCPYCKKERVEDLQYHKERCLQYLFHYNQGA